MYNQECINSVGEAELERILTGKQYFKISTTQKYFNYLLRYYALQHYLVKKIIKNPNFKHLAYEEYFNDFFKRPYLFYDSPLLNGDIIKAVYGKPLSDYVINYRNAYFSSDILRRDRNRLNQKEEERLFAYYLKSLSNPKTELMPVLEWEIKKIVNSDFNSLSEIKKTFYFQYIVNFVLKKRKASSRVIMGQDKSKRLGSQYYPYIFIEETMKDPIEVQTEIAAHEARHAIQHRCSRKTDTLTGFYFAQKNLFSTYLDTDTYDSYHANYNYSPIEMDAEYFGYEKTIKFFNTFGRPDLAQETEDNFEVCFINKYYGIMINKDGQWQTVDSFIVENMDNILKKHPENYTYYPHLRQIYNINGTRKTIEELLLGKMNETDKNRGIFNTYLIYEITNNKLNSLQLDKYNTDAIDLYLHALYDLFDQHILTLDVYFKDVKPKHSKRQIEFVVKHEIEIIYKILLNIYKNYNILTTPYVNDQIVNTNPLYLFTIYLRKFSFKKVKNEKILESAEIKKSMYKLTKLNAELISDFNMLFIVSKLQYLPREILDAKIKILGYGEPVFKDFFIGLVLPRLDENMNIRINGRKWFAGDLINAQAKKVMTRINKDQERRIQ